MFVYEKESLEIIDVDRNAVLKHVFRHWEDTKDYFLFRLNGHEICFTAEYESGDQGEGRNTGSVWHIDNIGFGYLRDENGGLGALRVTPFQSDEEIEALKELIPEALIVYTEQHYGHVPDRVIIDEDACNQERQYNHIQQIRVISLRMQEAYMELDPDEYPTPWSAKKPTVRYWFDTLVTRQWMSIVMPILGLIWAPTYSALLMMFAAGIAMDLLRKRTQADLKVASLQYYREIIQNYELASTFGLTRKKLRKWIYSFFGVGIAYITSILVVDEFRPELIHNYLGLFQPIHLYLGIYIEPLTAHAAALEALGQQSRIPIVQHIYSLALLNIVFGMPFLIHRTISSLTSQSCEYTDKRAAKLNLQLSTPQASRGAFVNGLGLFAISIAIILYVRTLGLQQTFGETFNVLTSNVGLMAFYLGMMLSAYGLIIAYSQLVRARMYSSGSGQILDGKHRLVFSV